MIIYVDGACSGNGSATAVGGFGVVALDENENFLHCYSKHNENTTNNKEELRAIIYALIRYGKEKPTPIVYSDSAYAVNSLNIWRLGWEQNGWLKKDNKPPENLEFIKAYTDLWNQGYRIDLRKCAGHRGLKWNEMADTLAVVAKERKS